MKFSPSILCRFSMSRQMARKIKQNQTQPSKAQKWYLKANEVTE